MILSSLPDLFRPLNNLWPSNMLITFTTANPLLIILSQEQVNAANDELMDYEEENLLRDNGENEADDNEESICPGQEGYKRIVGLSLIHQTRPRAGRAESLTHQPPGPSNNSLKLSPCILTCTSSPHPTSLPPSSTTTTTIPTSLYSSSAPPHSSTLNSSHTTTNPSSSSSNTTDSSPPSTPLHISPAHLHEEISSCYQSFLYHSSRTPIFQTFASDGPFPLISRFTFSSNPHEGLTRPCSWQLDDAIAEFRTTISQIHANNYQRLVEMENAKINNLVGSVKKILTPARLTELYPMPKRMHLITINFALTND